MNRRDLLKYFSIGTIITPLAADNTEQVVARLIEEPKVDIVPATKMPEPGALNNPQPNEGELYFTYRTKQHIYCFRARNVHLSSKTTSNVIDVTTHHHAHTYRELIQGPVDITITGVTAHDIKVTTIKA